MPDFFPVKGAAFPLLPSSAVDSVYMGEKGGFGLGKYHSSTVLYDTEKGKCKIWRVEVAIKKWDVL